MSSKHAARGVTSRQWIGAAGAIAMLYTAGGLATATADPLVEPPVFASQNGVLDIMMVAMPQPIPTISFAPPGGGSINPTGWVYQVCPRPPSGLSCPAESGTVSPYEIGRASCR